ncbi:MAG: pre-peptidase C-terminal domain-containing protein, partial [Pirellulaceae bacterium]|nr:pre-peptidase C-terminal domain-containing protein [Pirellulaceae bacterium]
MTNRKFRTVASPTSQNKADIARKRVRQMLLETLEHRQLLAVGPQLIGVQPNNSDLLVDGAVRSVGPRELTFRFDDAQVIDPATLSGIRITRAGNDGSFGQFSASTDFGSSGAVNVQLTARAQATAVTINFAIADLGPSGVPLFATVGGNTLNVTLNSNAQAPTTAAGLVNAINLSPIAAPLVIARVNGGLGATSIGALNPASYSPVQLSQAGDAVIQPGAVLVGASPNENEVTVRFAETLPDDNYRIENFGFDDPVRGIVGLRNVGSAGQPGSLFVPNTAGTRQNTIDFRLDLGSQVTAVVPQPVVRTANGLQQQRDTIVVYFDADKLLVENDAFGRPTARSAENPAFYQLILTNDSVRNTDDIYFAPTSVRYNATTNTATLKFAGDINTLGGSAPSTFRLRVGTRETAPIAPTYSEAAATVISDLNTGGLAKVRFTSRQVGEAGAGVRVEVINTNSGTPVVTAAGNVVRIDLGRANLTAQEFVTLVNNSSDASSLLSASLEAGSLGSAQVGNRTLSYSPLNLVGLGSSFNTATNIGTIGSANQLQTSLVLGSSIDPESFALDLLGASNDPGHRVLPQNQLGSFEGHVNQSFGADNVDGITTIFYNFRSTYSSDLFGVPLVNAISEIQKQRAREALGLWAKYVGVQFVETSDLGVTIATGAATGLRPLAGTQIQNSAARNFGVRIDPTFENSLVILSATNTWNDNYGESYFRAMAAGIGMVLGLEHAGDLPESTLMRLDPTFLAGSGVLINANDAQLNASDEQYEPIFPGNQDVLHGQYLYRPDGSDVDLYRFDVDFGGQDRVGLFTAETYAERLTNSSALNTNLELFRATQATASTNFGAGDALQVRFESLLPGTQGNHFQIRFTQSDRGLNAKPGVTVGPNSVSVDLNARAGSESTVADVLAELAASAPASKLVKATLVRGAATTRVGNNTLTQNPVVLLGGRMELVAQNDDYFSRDSVIKQSLTAGVYYIGVSASGNDSYDATVEGTGFGGKSQGDYQLRISFRAQVDTTDTLQDISGSNDPAVALDGDGDGVPGGNHDFWFQTRPLDRVVSFNAGATAALEGRVITVVGGNGVLRDFEFDSNGIVGAGRIAISYVSGDAAGTLANAVAAAIVSRSELGVSAIANGARLTLRGERLIRIDPALVLIDVSGKTIFVDKAAGPNADGSLARPFNNISATGVASAFASALPGDIVRIVGNGGVDGNLATLNDNFAYEIGTGLLPGSILSDGSTMEIPRGVTTMIDAGAIFKLLGARIGVGSSNLNIDRSDSALQVLGTPVLLDAAGNAVRQSNGAAVAGNVFFTSWLDESLGLDTFTPRTTPSTGDWGGISYRRDVDVSAGRTDLEDEGIFLQYVNQSVMRYGGGTVLVDSIQTSINPIEMLDTRPTITNNQISFAANAALSALPNSFEETNFNEPRFQVNGAFTSDYDRVGPEIRNNQLINNSLNGLFIRVDTPADGLTRTLTVPGRFDDIDIVHVISENLIVSGSTGGAILDSTVPPADLISTAASVGGILAPGTYNYKLSYLDRNGYESIPSNVSVSQLINPGETAIRIAGLPAATGDYVARRLYRSNGLGQGPYELVATLDRQTSTYLDIGKVLGGTLTRDRADVSGVTLERVNGGTLAVGSYAYRVVMIDGAGREGLASNVTASFALTPAGSIQLQNLPLTLNGYVARRIYRSVDGGAFVRVADLPDSTSQGVGQFLDTGATAGGELSVEAFAVKRPRATASLVIDPGTVIKLEAARIEATFGANIIAEGTDGLPITFTSKLDDRVGAGGTFDTNNNLNANRPSPRDWGGIYMAPTSTLSVDHARFSYAGGVTKLDGTFRAFNTIELQQAEGRIANSVFEDNANGFGGQGPGSRFGRMSNSQATIFVRGAQPIIIDNVFRNNDGSAIDIDANSMTDTIMGDSGRQTGAADKNSSYDSNRGPLIRNNRMIGNDLNGLEIRGDTLTTASVWDDTDIVHVLFDGIFIENVQHEGGLRLQSAANESLVVKFFGYGSNFNRNLGAGITASGQLTSGNNRIGGALHVLGQPGFPVILTSLRDDTVGAGLEPDGSPQTDTNNDGIGSIPQSADWRGLLLDQDSNDRNVAPILETESPTSAAPGPNGSALSAQVLGDLAARPSASSENLRLGFAVEGVLGQREDVDVYSFTAEAGSEIWLDVDYTNHNTDLVLELLDANGSLLARSDDSTFETIDPALLVTTGLISSSNVNRMPVRVNGVRTTSAGLVKEDGTINPSDPGMRVLLPGAANTRSTFYFRVRSASADINAIDAGLTKGSYHVQVRLREQQEFAGSTIDFADIRYAMNGVRLRGLPGTSPLIGEAQEDESVGNGQTFAN